MKRLMKALFILALIFCFAMPVFAIKILPYDVPLQDLMKWDKYDATLKLSNPEGETLSIAWASTVDLWNYDGATWTFDLPSGDTFKYSKVVDLYAGMKLVGTAVTSTAAELNILDGVTATYAELNALDGITATVTELNYTDGVTSAIQTQLDLKAPLAAPTFTGAVTISGSIATVEKTPVNAVASQGTITMAGLATADETFVIDTQTFTWKAARSVAGEVTIGAIAADAVTNIVTAVTADLATVTAVDGAGDTVTVTAATKGVAGNSIVFTEASTNMTVDGAGTLGTTTAGINGTVGVANEIVQDTTYLYVCIATNTIADTNWRRIALGSVY